MKPSERDGLHLGIIKRAKEIGYRGGNEYMWCACIHCGLERWVQIQHHKPKSLLCHSCGVKFGLKRNQWGENHPNWKGGRRVTKEGYVIVCLHPDNFFYPMTSKNGLVMEHRLVMAKHLGRNLHRWEIVHHKNHIKDENRIDNLQLVSDDRHRQISILERRISQLEDELKHQGKFIKLLQWQIGELRKDRMLNNGCQNTG